MSCTMTHHHKLDAEGRGRCSVPMFMGGGSAGFCDETAYGERLPTRIHIQHYPGGYREWAEDGGYTGHVPGLACPRHSGPKTRVFKDGSAWCAVRPDFINLQESDAGFGDTPEAARAALAKVAVPAVGAA